MFSFSSLIRRFSLVLCACTLFGVSMTYALTPPHPTAHEQLDIESLDMIRQVANRSYRKNPTSLAQAQVFLKSYIEKADENNTKWKMAQQVWKLFDDIQHPKKAYNTVDAKTWSDIVPHLPFGIQTNGIIAIEFTDMQCPYCARLHNQGSLKKLDESYAQVDKVMFDFPLSFHAQARPAAEARQCVWKYMGYDAAERFVDNVFATGLKNAQDIQQNIHDTTGIYGDTPKNVWNCYESHSTQKSVEKQMSIGRKLGVTGTPGTIFIDVATKQYAKVSGAVPYENFVKVIEPMIRKDRANVGGMRNPMSQVIIPTPSFVIHPTNIHPQQAKTIFKINETAHESFLKKAVINGNKDAKVSIIEFSDFQCPFCQRHANNNTLYEVQQKYGKDNVNVIFAHFPLSFHPNAQKAGEALECAGYVGGEDMYMEFKKTLFAKGGKASLEQIDDVATELGINNISFNSCLDSDMFAQKVKDQMAYGRSLGVTGTPGNLVINNETGEYVKVSGAVPASSFYSSISNYLNIVN